MDAGSATLFSQVSIGLRQLCFRWSLLFGPSSLCGESAVWSCGFGSNQKLLFRRQPDANSLSVLCQNELGTGRAACCARTLPAKEVRLIECGINNLTPSVFSLRRQCQGVDLRKSQKNERPKLNRLSTTSRFEPPGNIVGGWNLNQPRHWVLEK